VNGGVQPPLTLASGDPGLKIIYKTTNQFVIFIDEPWTVGPGLIAGMDERQIQVISDRHYGLMDKFRSKSGQIGIPQQLYPFDDKAVFASDGANWDPVRKVMIWPGNTQVFFINGDDIAVSNNVFALARARYSLATNQLFLGRIGTNVYYWETQDPRKVLYRAAAGERATNYFELPKGIMDIFGVTQGVKEKDNVGFAVLRKSKGFSYSPNEFTFIEVSFKTAKQVKDNK
jgi:hypothetical protein